MSQEKKCKTEYSKADLTYYAKQFAKANNYLATGICMAEDNVCEDIVKRILRGDESLLIEVSKRFAKHTKDDYAFFGNSPALQDFEELISKIIGCCEENNWFDSNTN